MGAGHKGNGPIPISLDHKLDARLSPEHRRLLPKLMELRSDPLFREQCARTKRLMAMGKTLFEIQDRINLAAPEDGDRWEMVKFAVLIANLSTDAILEYIARSNARYQMAAQTYRQAEKAKELGVKLGAIKLMVDIDKSDIEIKKTLGVLHPALHAPSGGTGYLDEDKDGANEEIRSLVIDVENRLKSVARIRLPVSAAALTRDVSGQETDHVGTAPVDGNAAGGSKPRDPNP